MSPITFPTHSAAVLYGAQDIRIEERPSFKPPRGFAEVRIQATGLCGSDLHYYTDGRNGDFALRSPLVLGHEASGIITALGPNAISPNGKPLRIGQRVAIEAGIPCSKAPSSSTSVPSTCVYCMSGRYNLCKDLRFASSAKTFPHLDGTLQEKMVHPASLLYPLPDSVSPALGALSEPLSVVLHASRRAGLLQHPLSPASLHFASSASPSSSSTSLSTSSSLSSSSSTNPFSSASVSHPHPSYLSHHLSSPQSAQTVLVFGAGTIGLMTCALAQAFGAKKVVAVDINRSRLEFAKKNGFADMVYCLPHPSNQQPQPASCCSPSAPKTQQPQQQSKDTINSILERAKERALAALTAFKQPDGFDIVYECTGAEACIQMAIHTATLGGKVMLIGMGTRNTTLPLSAAALREVDILGSFRYAGTYEEVLELLDVFAEYSHKNANDSNESESSTVIGEDGIRKSLPDLTSLITHHFDLKDTQKAFDMMKTGVDEKGGMVMKVVIS